MTTSRAPSFATLALHAGVERDPAAGARGGPNASAGSIGFDGAPLWPKSGLRTFAGIHMQAENPAVAALEERIAALEDGVAAVAASSGRAAQVLTFHMLMRPGEDIIAARTLRGGSTGGLGPTFDSFGWRLKWADPDDPSTFAAAIGPRTKAIFIESISHTDGAIVDLEAIADIARAVKIPLIVDNSLATPYLIRPFEHGADIVVHSSAGLLGGHGDWSGGLVIDGGGFDWLADARYPMLSAPRPEYGGTTLAETFANFGFAMGARALGLRDLGCAIAPLDASFVLSGVETLSLRMQRQCDSAQSVAERLARDPAVAWVSHPSLAGDKSHALAQKYCPHGAGGVLSLGLKGGYDAAAALVCRLRLFSHLAEASDSRSRAVHPASHEPPALEDDAEAAPAPSPEAVRLSIGIEDKIDILADLGQALEDLP